jgi:D-alanine-D-alanine ligase
VLGDDRPEALPLVELDLSRLPKDMPRIAGREVKFDVETTAYKRTRSRLAKDLDEDTVGRIQGIALAVFQALRLRDYGRVDLRLRADGEIYVIEANPNPWIASGAELAMAARAAGRSYPQLIGEIVDGALHRRP